MNLVYPLLAAIIGIALVKWNKKTAAPMLAVYLIFIIVITLVIRQPNTESIVRIAPFHSMKRIFKTNNKGLLIALLTGETIRIRHYVLEPLMQNLLLFIPLGYLVPSVWKRIDSYLKLITIALLTSTSIEVMQYFTRLGYADIEDVFMNVFGAFIGFLIFRTVLCRE